MPKLPEIHSRAVWFRWSAAQKMRQLSVLLLQESSVLCSSQPKEKKGLFFFIFCTYCRVKTSPREWTAGFSSSPEPTDRQNCLLSSSQRHCGRWVTEGLLTWGTAWGELRASSDLWNFLILGTWKEHGKFWSCAPEPKLNLPGFGNQNVSAMSVVSVIPYTHKYVIIVLQHSSKWGVNHN